MLDRDDRRSYLSLGIPQPTEAAVAPETLDRLAAQLTRARQAQTDPEWMKDYTATRPKVERKIAHMMRRRHGARRARVRGQNKVDADFSLLGAATNLARLATLGLTHHNGGWVAHRA